MIHLLIFPVIILVILPTMLIAAKISLSAYVMTLSAIGILLGIAGITYLLLTAGPLMAAVPFFAAPIMLGMFACLIMGSVSLYCYKKTGQLEQIKVPVKTKKITENELKQKHS